MSVVDGTRRGATLGAAMSGMIDDVTDVQPWQERAVDMPNTSLAFNAALSDERAALLLDGLDLPPDGSVLDLGCGWGELLLRAMARAPGARGLGIDRDESALARARATAVARGLDTRVRFEPADLRTYVAAPADVVIAVGIGHVRRQIDESLDFLHRHVRPGGSCLFADGFWRATPTADQRAQLGPHRDLVTLDALVAAAAGGGFVVEEVHEASDAEMDHFTSTTLRDLTEMSMARRDEEAVRILERQRECWRHVLLPLEGFAYLVLRRPVT